MQKGSIIELLEPYARSFNNIPRSDVRQNCAPNNGQFKATSMIISGSKNYFQWRVKRPSKDGRCTIKMSNDGETFLTLTPHGKSKSRFNCGRTSGYESAEFVVPKQIQNDKGAILQLEFETENGVILQCADLIVQKYQPFVAT